MAEDESMTPRLPRYSDLPKPIDEVPRRDPGDKTDPHPSRALAAGRPDLDAAEAKTAPNGETDDPPPSDRPTAGWTVHGLTPRPEDQADPQRPDDPLPSSSPPREGDEAERPSYDFRIGLWGAPSSGKTLLLQMLPTAAKLLGWTDTPVGKASVEFYNRAARSIVNKEALLPGTQDNTLITLQLDKSAGTARPGFAEGLRMRVPPLRRRIETTATTITIQTVDRPGDAFATNIDAVVDELRATDAIIFLYDPTRDIAGTRDRTTLDYFSKCLDTLRDRSRRQLVGGALPQAFAVCITKFDSVPVFALARSGFWTTQDDSAPYSPRVDDAHAKPFFDWLCNSEQQHPAAQWVRDEVASKFPAARTRYFVTSAAGFRRDGEGEVDLAFPDNVRDRPSGDGATAGMAQQLVSIPHPVNVMEPIVALREMASGSRR